MVEEVEIERIYTIPLRKAKSVPRNRRAARAIREVKEFLSKHMKSSEVWIDSSLNEAIWSKGIRNIPSRIRVRAAKFDSGVVEVSMPGKKELIRKGMEEVEEEEIEEGEEIEEEKEKEIEEVEEEKEIEGEEVEEKESEGIEEEVKVEEKEEEKENEEKK
jgi:large subunit ribosomal protein L31e